MPKPGVPESFKVLVKELQALCLDVRVLDDQGEEIELREETSLASFIAGFRLGMGIAREIEPYSFEDEEERRATEKAKAWHPQSKN